MQLDDAIEAAFTNIGEQMLADLIVEKAKEQGHALTKRDLQTLVAAVLSGSSVGHLKGKWWKCQRGALSLDFTPEDLEALERQQANLVEAMPKIVTEVLTGLSDDFEAALRRKWPAERRLSRRRARAAQRAIQRTWGRALDELECLLTLAEHFSATCDAAPDRDARGEAVLR